MKKWYICVVCEKRKETEKKNLIANGFGVCESCMEKLPFSDGNGCFEGSKNISHIISAFYYEGQIKHILHEYKFRQKKIYADILSHFINKLIDEHTYLKNFDMVCPVPLSSRRLNERGYNQSGLIAQKTAKHLNIPFSDDILIRTRHTQRQSGLKGVFRLYNVLDAFDASADLTDKRIILFDDIFTVGFTMNECAKTLKKAGACEIVGVVAAIVKK